MDLGTPAVIGGPPARPVVSTSCGVRSLREAPSVNGTIRSCTDHLGFASSITPEGATDRSGQKLRLVAGGLQPPERPRPHLRFADSPRSTLASFASQVSDPQAVVELVELRILCLGLLQDGNVGISVFPQWEEIPVGGESTGAGSIGCNSLVCPRLQRIRNCCGIGTAGCRRAPAA